MRLRFDAVAADDRDRDPWRLLEDRREQVARFDGVTAGSAGVEQRELEEQLRRRRNAEAAAGSGRQHPEVLLERLQNLVRVEREVAHDLAEHVPLDLRECQAEMFVGQHARVRGAAPRRERGPRHVPPTQPICSAGYRSPPRRPPGANPAGSQQDAIQHAWRPAACDMRVERLGESATSGRSVTSAAQETMAAEACRHTRG